jgi:hypothetical protein
MVGNIIPLASTREGALLEKGKQDKDHLRMKQMTTLVLTILLMTVSAFAADVVNKKTIAYWSLDEGKGQKVKDAANGNIGDIQKAEWAKGISGSALKFNGKDARVMVQNNKTLHSETGDLTIQAWVNVTGNPGKWSGAGGVVFKQGAYQWCVKKEGVLWFGIWGARLESGGDFDFLDKLNKWHHTAVTFKGKSRETKIYVDGKLKTKGTVNEAVDPTGDPLYIGFKGDGNHYFEGLIDEVHISNAVLSKDEMTEMMKITLAVETEDKLPVKWAKLKNAN